MRRWLLFPLLLLAASAYAAGPTTQAVNSPAQSLANLTARAVDLHASTGDAATIAIPAYVTAYQIMGVKITNCSATPIAATVGIYSAASQGGTNIVAQATITGATAASIVLDGTLASTARLTAGTIYVNLSVINAAALTCDFHLQIADLT